MGNNDDQHRSAPTLADETTDKEVKMEEEDDTTDEEGLRRKYDVILYGTGLVESIVASALARAGKSILHCDASEYYGSLDAIWTLPFIREHLKPNEKRENTSAAPDAPPHGEEERQRRRIPVSPLDTTVGLVIHSMQRLQNYTIARPNTMVHTTYGMAQVSSVAVEQEYSRVHITLALTTWTLANGSHPNLHLAIPLEDLRNSMDNKDEIHQKNPSDWTSSELQRVVDQYYAASSSSSATTAAQQTPTSPRAVSSGACMQSWHERVDKQLLEETRSASSFALDISPGLLFAWGPAVQGLLRSGVSDYMEFKSLEQLLYASSSSNTKNDKGGPILKPVPCSKNDVFSSTLLSPMEKRRLMKFLQLALDYGLLLNNSDVTSGVEGQESNEETPSADKTKDEQEQEQRGLEPVPMSEEAVTSWNERHLNQGRSLARPQNKAVTTQDMTILQQCLEEHQEQEGLSSVWQFERYLREKHKLSQSLVSLVRYALALEPIADSSLSSSCTSLEQGMKRLCRHVQALGRFGTTAFLVPLYGSGELSQAFCRSAAVYGGTYLLRRSVVGISTDGTNDDGNHKPNDQVTGVWLQPPAPEELDPEKQPESETNPSSWKLVACDHVIVPENSLAFAEPSTSSGGIVRKRRVMRRISIVRGKPLVSSPDEQQRLAIILPPQEQQSNGSSTDHSYTIHGLVFDESVHVAPHLSVREPRIGCSVMHLSTVVDDEGNDDEKEVNDSILQRAMKTVLEQQKQERMKKRQENKTPFPSGGDGDGQDSDDCQEIFHVEFSYPLFDEGAVAAGSNTNGLHIVHRPAPGLVLDSAFEQAKVIFEKICPNQEFLMLAEEIDTMVKERFGDRRTEEDDETRVLESAMDIIQQKDDDATDEKD